MFLRSSVVIPTHNPQLRGHVLDFGPPETGWPSYISRHSVLILVVCYGGAILIPGHHTRNTQTRQTHITDASVLQLG